MPLKIDNGWVSLISRDTRLCQFCSYYVVENEAHFVLEWPLYNPIRHEFPSLFENVVLGSLKSFVQIDQHVNISLYVIEVAALCHSRELIGLKPSSCTFIPVSLFGFPDYKINFISFSYHTRTFILRQNRPSIHIIWNSIGPNSNWGRQKILLPWHTHRSSINVWLVLRFWYPWVGCLIPLLMFDHQYHAFTYIPYHPYWCIP